MPTYTPPVLSGYNFNPPPDNNTKTPANKVTWKFHTDKIGDPLKNFSEAINAEVGNAFDAVDTAIAIKPANIFLNLVPQVNFTANQIENIQAGLGFIIAIMPTSGTLKNLYVQVNGPYTLDSDVVVTVEANGSPTPITVTITQGSTALFTDITNTAAFVAGDKLSYNITHTGTVGSVDDITFSLLAE